MQKRSILFRITIILAALTLGSAAAKADEGMWMIHAINEALERKMQEKGLNLSAKDIYDAEAEGSTISDAIVSLEFGCTGSIISDQGLVITNHHCAYGDVHNLSTPEKNYLEDGFWAFRQEEEIPIKGKRMLILKKVIDVSEDVENLKKEYCEKGVNLGSRKISYLLEKKFSEETGLEAYLSSFWGGSLYYMALYEIYSDIRLVAAPPVSSAAFGGDIDNWEWPQHKCDFAMYRIYTAPDGSAAEYSESNIPLVSKAKLKISSKGYKPGDFTMVIGYPGSTNRYSSAAEVAQTENVSNPISNKIRGEQMAIINQKMNESEEVRLKYADYYFSLSNVQELNCGEVQCTRRFKVIDKKAAVEGELQKWIEQDSNRCARWGKTICRLNEYYKNTEDIERNKIYFRETLVRGSQLFNIVRRAYNSRNPNGVGKKMLQVYDQLCMDVEKDLVRYSIQVFVENVSEDYMSDYHKTTIKRFNNDPEAIFNFIWENSLFTTPEGIARLGAREAGKEEIHNDPLCQWVMSQSFAIFRKCQEKHEVEGSGTELRKQYKQALYCMKNDTGKMQYPDANSTLRITYGTIGGIEPYDGVILSWRTTTDGILEKYDPSKYEFRLDERQLKCYKEGSWGRWGDESGKMYVNFMSDNDITGGNSGSPVLNGDGELIGLAFDGNKESLDSNVWYTAGYNKCINVDIRYVLWTLEHYAGMTRIIEEIGI